MSVKKIKIDSALPRILLVVLTLVCLVFVFFAAKWFLGNSIAGGVIQREVADFAVTLAPNDPRTHLVEALRLDFGIKFRAHPPLHCGDGRSRVQPVLC